MDTLKTELHCHNVYSNFHTNKLDTPYDCNVTIYKQLEQSYRIGLDIIFITNHNTLHGYKQLLDYKNNHKKYNCINVYPAEEITSITGEHVLAYGVVNEIKSGLSVNEIFDEIKKQGAVSSAPHPFSLIDSLRVKSKYCDMIEIFNSNNVDIFSNIKAQQFAIDNKIICVCGSDSHIASTLGRCINQIESENTLDDVLFSMKHKKIKIQKFGYALENEIMEHLKYKIDNSKSYITKYININYPKEKLIFTLLLKMYYNDPNSYIWNLFYRITVIMLKKTSLKINMNNYNPIKQHDRKFRTFFKFFM